MIDKSKTDKDILVSQNWTEKDNIKLYFALAMSNWIISIASAWFGMTAVTMSAAAGAIMFMQVATHREMVYLNK